MTKGNTDSIGCVAILTTKIKIFPTKAPALYQKLSKKITQLRLLGLSIKEIAKQLNISKETVENALKWARR